jgi:omega-amidase
MSTLTFSLIQTKLFWEDKTANLHMLEEKINSIATTEIIVLPEMFSTGFSMNPVAFAEKMDGRAVNWMRNIATQKKVILTGSIIVEENGKYFNRLIWMLPNGNYGLYDKRHLFAFAGEHKHYTAGGKRLIASVKGWKINLQVCYDLRFPVWARQTMPAGVLNYTNENTNEQPEYDVLLYVANWPEKRNHAWKTLLQARAIENQCFVIGVNRVGDDGNKIYYSGDSMVIDGMGATWYHKQHEEDVHTVTLHKKTLHELRSNFPFLKDADRFYIEP